ncbi:MAG: hypothetical protein KC484_06545 [Colwelliaceae bacterium]|jgi:hypothetical protein|nr:hypothetical protein [Colwelliaceae bacterium]
MTTKLSKWKVSLIAISLLSIPLFIYSFTMKDEFCPVIDDSRIIDTIAVVNMFNESKISYFVDYQNSYQILVEKSQLDEAYNALSVFDIKTKSNYQSMCKVVH